MLVDPDERSAPAVQRDPVASGDDARLGAVLLDLALQHADGHRGQQILARVADDGPGIDPRADELLRREVLRSRFGCGLFGLLVRRAEEPARQAFPILCPGLCGHAAEQGGYPCDSFHVSVLFYFSFSTASSHTAADASEGIRQSPRGERETLPTFGPSGRAERLNCWAKKRRKKVCIHFRITSRG